MTEKYTDDPFSDLEAKARASREALKERLGDKMPVREKVAFSSDWDPCAAGSLLLTWRIHSPPGRKTF